MADNYLLFSEEIETESDEAARWIEAQLKKAVDSDEGGIHEVEIVRIIDGRRNLKNLGFQLCLALMP